MLSNKEIVVVMPAYNAEKTLRQTYEELPHEYVDEVILVEPSQSASVADTITWREVLKYVTLHKYWNVQYVSHDYQLWLSDFLPVCSKKGPL